MKTIKLESSKELESMLAEECVDFVKENGIVTIPDMPVEELVETAMSYGKSQERKKWEKPEEYYLANKYAALLQEAKDEYERETGVLCDSIEIAPAGENQHKIIVKPTYVVHLFNIFMRHGKKVAALQQE